MMAEPNAENVTQRAGAQRGMDPPDLSPHYSTADPPASKQMKTWCLSLKTQCSKSSQSPHSKLSTTSRVHSRARQNWNCLFLAFLTLAAGTIAMSALAGFHLLPENVLHSSGEEVHPSNNLRQHNLEHARQFANAYRNPNKSQERVPPKYHMVFSTSCSPFQNWQGLAFFYFARKVRQPGTITRLVSGCSPEDEKRLKTIHEERVVPLAIEGVQEFELHVTPNFDDSAGGDQKYFNKPNGLLHWMEQKLGFKAGSDHEQDDDIVIIVDPDMMLLRPITDDVTIKNYARGWVNASENIPSVDSANNVVTHGQPYAQRYGYGDSWLGAVKDHLEYIVGPDSPVLTMSNKIARGYYPAGPPYIATAKDMFNIATHWVKFLPRYHEFFDGMMCEMHSYSLAAAHLNLPHKLAEGFMVSDVEADENFDFIDTKLTFGNACMNAPELVPAVSETPVDARDATTMTDPAYEAMGISMSDLPFVLHFCQRYAMGRYFFSKYKLPENTFDDCNAPMMIEPPRNVGDLYDWNVFPNGQEKWNFEPAEKNPNEVGEKNKVPYRKRFTWMLCAVVYGVNEAVRNYKGRSCGTDAKYFQKTFHFHDEKNFTESLKNRTRPWAVDEYGF